MPTYERRTLAGFSAPLSPAKALKVITDAGRKVPIGMASDRALLVPYSICEEIAVPFEVAKSALLDDCTKAAEALALAVNTWLASATAVQRALYICSALHMRTETLTSDAKWKSQYASEVSRVFGIPPDAPRNAMDRDGETGKSWGFVVAEHTVNAMVLDHPEALEPLRPGGAAQYELVPVLSKVADRMTRAEILTLIYEAYALGQDDKPLDTK